MEILFLANSISIDFLRVSTASFCIATVFSSDIVSGSGTDESTSSSSGVGKVAIKSIEAGSVASPTANQSISDLVELDTVGFIEFRSDDGNYSPVPEGGIVFDQSAASDELVLEDFLMFITEDGDNIKLEEAIDTFYEDEDEIDEFDDRYED